MVHHHISLFNGVGHEQQLQKVLCPAKVAVGAHGDAQSPLLEEGGEVLPKEEHVLWRYVVPHERVGWVQRDAPLVGELPCSVLIHMLWHAASSPHELLLPPLHTVPSWHQRVVVLQKVPVVDEYLAHVQYLPYRASKLHSLLIALYPDHASVMQQYGGPLYGVHWGDASRLSRTLHLHLGAASQKLSQHRHGGWMHARCRKPRVSGAPVAQPKASPRHGMGEHGPSSQHILHVLHPRLYAHLALLLVLCRGRRRLVNQPVHELPAIEVQLGDVLFQLWSLEGNALRDDECHAPTDVGRGHPRDVGIALHHLPLGSLAIDAHWTVLHDGAYFLLSGQVLQIHEPLVGGYLCHIPLYLLLAGLVAVYAKLPSDVVCHEHRESLCRSPSTADGSSIVYAHELGAIVVPVYLYPRYALQGSSHHPLGEQCHRSPDAALQRLQPRWELAHLSSGYVHAQLERHLLSGREPLLKSAQVPCQAPYPEQALHSLGDVLGWRNLAVGLWVLSPLLCGTRYGNRPVELILQ